MGELCNGFWIENEEDLKKLVSFDEYLDTIHGKDVLWWNSVELGFIEREDEIDDDWELGNALLVARLAKQLTQKELAQELGTSVSTISKLESCFNNDY